MRQSTQNGHVQTEDSGRMPVDMQSEKQKYEHSTRNDQRYKDFQQIHYPLLKVNLAVGVLRKCESWRNRPQAAHSLKYLQCLAGVRGALIERIGNHWADGLPPDYDASCKALLSTAVNRPP
jgi:hypothetical protein